MSINRHDTALGLGVSPGMFDELLRRGPDPRTPEEIAAAQAKENARRKGRGRKDWWKAHLDESGRLRD